MPGTEKYKTAKKTKTSKITKNCLEQKSTKLLRKKNQLMVVN